MKTNIRTLRRLAKARDFGVHHQGNGWVLQFYKADHIDSGQLHWSIKTEREALLYGFGQIAGNETLSAAELAAVGVAL